jgi:hypothetical protein
MALNDFTWKHQVRHEKVRRFFFELFTQLLPEVPPERQAWLFGETHLLFLLDF